MASNEINTPAISVIVMAKNIILLLRVLSVIFLACSKDGMSDSRKSTNNTF